EGLFRADLRFGIRGERAQGRIFLQNLIARRAVETARRRIEETLHARILGQLGQVHRGAIVNVKSQLRVQVTQGVVGERRQVNNRVETLEVGEGSVTDVFADPAMTFRRWVEIAIKVKIRIHSRDVVTLALK